MALSFRILTFGVLAFLAACASFDGRGLVPGKSTEAEAVALMGPTAQVLPLAGGGKALYFSRMPEGRAVFEVDVDDKGIVRSIEQKLTRQRIWQIVNGASTKDDVLKLFGPPGRQGYLTLSQREWWQYKYQDYQDLRILYVQFSGDGVVREVLDLRDLEREPGSRRKG
jgi:hypothetical protein